MRENVGTRENGGKSEKGGLIFFQGAPEIVLPRCTNYFDGEKTEKIDRPMLEARLREQTRRGRRVLALAFAETQSTENVRNDLPENAVFLGFAVLRDELRKETRKAVEDLTNAGVQVVMITGDHAETADAIAKEAGLYLGALKGEKPVVLTGNELAAMTDEDVTAILPRLRVVARALPTDKSRLVSLAQKKGYVTGMTGDGINDAAALKKADVGFALGSGTEVAKEAGDVVITDDDLSSVAKAVSYGRQHQAIRCVSVDDEFLRGGRIFIRAVYRFRYARNGDADAVDQYDYGYARLACVRGDQGGRAGYAAPARASFGTRSHARSGATGGGDGAVRRALVSRVLEIPENRRVFCQKYGGGRGEILHGVFLAVRLFGTFRRVSRPYGFARSVLARKGRRFVLFVHRGYVRLPDRSFVFRRHAVPHFGAYVFATFIVSRACRHGAAVRRDSEMRGTRASQNPRKKSEKIV